MTGKHKNIGKIYTLGSGNHILYQDLTDIVTDHKDIKELYAQLLALCRRSNGIGLAANQVGLRENFFLVMPAARLYNAKSVAHVCINPTWEPAPKSRMFESEEGCLSIPGKKFKVQRHTHIVASWTSVQGHTITDAVLKGKGAVVFQHEHDHLRGITLNKKAETL